MQNMENIRDITILYVEDDDRTREELFDILKEHAKDVYEAENGEVAFEIFLEKKPDIVVTDIKMPKSDGLDLARKIKKIDKNSIVMLLTAYSDEFNLMEAIDIGIDVYLNKPIRPFELLRKLSNFATIVMESKSQEEKEKLEKYNMLLNAKMEILQDISHHWRQPLSSLGLVLFIVEEAIDSGKLENANSNLAKAQNMIENLSKSISNFAKIYSKDKGIVTNITIKELVMPSLYILNVYLKESNISVELNLDESIEIECRAKNFTQAIISILKNSIEAKTRNHLENSTIEISATKEDSHYSLKIEDTSGGFDEKEELNKIFEPYFSTKANLNNNGLSLFLIKNYFERELNSEIIAKRANKGLIIEINIPK